MPIFGTFVAASVKALGALRKLGTLLTPTGLSSSTPSCTEVSVSWTNTNGTFPIYVYRGGSYLTTVSAGSTSYSNTGLSGGTSYSYQVAYYFEGVVNNLSSSTSSTTPSCCAAANTYYSSYCSGCDYYYRYNDGSCGYYDTLQASNSCSCGCGCSGGCCPTTLYITLDCPGDGYLCVSGPCGYQQDDDSAGSADSLVTCNSHGSYTATCGAYGGNYFSSCELYAGYGTYQGQVGSWTTYDCNGYCNGSSVSFYW